MGWFDEQIRQRKENDQNTFEESVLKMASVVMGNRRAGLLTDERIVTKNVIDEILKYYHFKSTEIPDGIGDFEDRLEYALRPHGLMYRRIELKDSWYKDGIGPLIAIRKSDGMPVALLPAPVQGYCIKEDNGSLTKVRDRNSGDFETEAICFYKPMPQRKLGIPDLVRYLIGCLNAGDFVLLAGLTLLVALVGLLLPHLTKLLTGFVLNRGQVSLLWGTAAFLICVLVSSKLIGLSNSMASARMQTKTSLAVESAVMMRILSLPPAFFKRFSSGELSGRNQSVNQLCSLLMGQVFTVGISSITSLIYITQIFRFAPQLMLISILIIVTTVALSVITTIWQMHISRRMMEYKVKEEGLTFSLINSVPKIKLAGAEKRAFAKWVDAYVKGAALQYNPPLFLKINGAITMAVSLAGTMGIYYIAVTTGISPSEYYAFNTAYGMVMGAFSALAGIAVSVAQIQPILEMAEPILSAEPETADDKEIVTSLSGAIELNNVCFRYQNNMPYIVDGLNLKIRAGEYVAIVGRTGCGKSTLMRLLLGFETPQKGAVYYDGKDIQSVDLSSLRKKIGVVMQDSGLFQGDIFSNIAISAPTLTMDQAWEAAETAGIADDIRAMPMQMLTVISEGQGGISGGQKQRLMIARAIAPKPRILMFDEATSALDNRTQKQIAEALDGLKCTRIVIAHRLSTIKNCDRILVLEEGRIIEEGSYEELIAENGYFADLVERQRIDKDH